MRLYKNGVCHHVWIPLCSYALSDGSRWMRYKCEKCGETKDRQMTE